MEVGTSLCSPGSRQATLVPTNESKAVLQFSVAVPEFWGYSWVLETSHAKLMDPPPPQVLTLSSCMFSWASAGYHQSGLLEFCPLQQCFLSSKTQLWSSSACFVALLFGCPVTIFNLSFIFLSLSANWQYSQCCCLGLTVWENLYKAPGWGWRGNKSESPPTLLGYMIWCSLAGDSLQKGDLVCN